MSTRIIVEQFNIYNDSGLDYYDYNNYNLDVITNNDIPKFQLRFYVKNTCFSENMDGKFQFSRKYRRKFNEIKELFCKKYGNIYDTSYDNYDPLETTNVIIKALKEKIEQSFSIPGQIELHSIELLGNWDVYHGEETSDLAIEFNKEIKLQFPIKKIE